MSQIKISTLPLINKITLDDVLIVNDRNTTTSHITWANTIRTLERSNLTFVGSVALDGVTRIGDFTYYSQEHLKKYPGILITDDQIAYWDESYSWGNHADAGYLDGSYTPEQSNYAETNTSLSTFIRNKPRLDIDANGNIGNVNVNLSYTSLINSGAVANDSGTGFVIPGATTTRAGLMTAAQAINLDNVEFGAQKNVKSDWTQVNITADDYILNKPNFVVDGNGNLTNVDVAVSYLAAVGDGTITVTSGTLSDTATVNVVDATNAGLMTAEDKVSLDTLSGLINASGNIEIDYTDIINAPIVINDGGNVDNIKVDLGYVPGVNNGTVTNNKGTNSIILAASSGTGPGTARAGLMTVLDKTKLEGIDAGAQVNVDQTQTYAATAVKGTLTLTGVTTDTTDILLATDSEAGLMSPGEKATIGGIEDGAQKNVKSDWIATSGDAEILNKPTLVGVLNDLSDVTVPSPDSGDVLLYNGSGWVNSGLGNSIVYGGVHDFIDSDPPAVAADPTIYIHNNTTVDSGNVGSGISDPDKYGNITAEVITNGDRVIYDPANTGAHWIIITGITDLPDTNLSYDEVTHIVDNDNGTGFTLPLAGDKVKINNVDTVVDGLMSVADKTSLDGLVGAPALTISQVYTPDIRTLTLSPGDDTTVLPLAGDIVEINNVDTPVDGLMSVADKAKLEGITPGAEVNVDPSQTYTASETKGTLTLSGGDTTDLPLAGAMSVSDGLCGYIPGAGLMSPGDKAKLEGITTNGGLITNIKTSLGYTAATDKGTVTESNSTEDSVIPLANTIEIGTPGGTAYDNAGLMTATQAAAVEDLILNPPTGATNLSYTPAAAGGTVTSSTGTDASLPMAGATVNIGLTPTKVAGLMSPDDKAKLEGSDGGAQKNVQSDWKQDTITSDDHILNKPSVIDTVVDSGVYATNQSFNPDPDNSIRRNGGVITITQEVTNYGADPSSPPVTVGTPVVITLPIATDADDGLMSAIDKLYYDAKLDDAPSDTFSYGRKDEAWSKVLPYDFTTLDDLT